MVINYFLKCLQNVSKNTEKFTIQENFHDGNKVSFPLKTYNYAVYNTSLTQALLSGSLDSVKNLVVNRDINKAFKGLDAINIKNIILLGDVKSIPFSHIGGQYLGTKSVNKTIYIVQDDNILGDRTSKERNMIIDRTNLKSMKPDDAKVHMQVSNNVLEAEFQNIYGVSNMKDFFVGHMDEMTNYSKIEKNSITGKIQKIETVPIDILGKMLTSIINNTNTKIKVSKDMILSNYDGNLNHMKKHYGITGNYDPNRKCKYESPKILTSKYGPYNNFIQKAKIGMSKFANNNRTTERMTNLLSSQYDVYRKKSYVDQAMDFGTQDHIRELTLNKITNLGTLYHIKKMNMSENQKTATLWETRPLIILNSEYKGTHDVVELQVENHATQAVKLNTDELMVLNHMLQSSTENKLLQTMKETLEAKDDSLIKPLIVFEHDNILGIDDFRFKRKGTLDLGGSNGTKPDHDGEIDDGNISGWNSRDHNSKIEKDEFYGVRQGNKKGILDAGTITGINGVNAYMSIETYLGVRNIDHTGILLDSAFESKEDKTHRILYGQQGKQILGFKLKDHNGFMSRNFLGLKSKDHYGEIFTDLNGMKSSKYGIKISLQNLGARKVTHDAKILLNILGTKLADYGYKSIKQRLGSRMVTHKAEMILDNILGINTDRVAEMLLNILGTKVVYNADIVSDILGTRIIDRNAEMPEGMVADKAPKPTYLMSMMNLGARDITHDTEGDIRGVLEGIRKIDHDAEMLKNLLASKAPGNADLMTLMDLGVRDVKHNAEIFTDVLGTKDNDHPGIIALNIEAIKSITHLAEETESIKTATLKRLFNGVITLDQYLAQREITRKATVFKTQSILADKKADRKAILVLSTLLAMAQLHSRKGILMLSEPLAVGVNSPSELYPPADIHDPNVDLNTDDPSKDTTVPPRWDFDPNKSPEEHIIDLIKEIYVRDQTVHAPANETADMINKILDGLLKDQIKDDIDHYTNIIKDVKALIEEDLNNLCKQETKWTNVTTMIKDFQSPSSWFDKDFTGSDTPPEDNNGSGLWKNADLTKNPFSPTASEIDSFLAINGGKLVGIGSGCIYAWENYGINPIYVMAHACWESTWGKSNIARDKNNLFGYGAYDWSPYESAWTFPSKSACIVTVMKHVHQDYLNPQGQYYGGSPTLVGMNKSYATDDNWGNGIASIMKQFYGKNPPNSVLWGASSVALISNWYRYQEPYEDQILPSKDV